MKRLSMKPFDKALHSLVEIDVDEDAITAKAGGFGVVCQIAGEDRFLAKRLMLRQPTAPGKARLNLLHVRLAKQRLGVARKTALQHGSEFVRTRVREYLDEILNNSLSTHYDFELDANHDVTSIWFLLPNASGKDLSEHFRDDRGAGPSAQQRVAYAEAFSRRMRTLRRPGFVHLDCTVDNIRLDRTSGRLVMIDLDGVGIEKQTQSNSNEWDVEPVTLGKQDRMVRVPPWYPQEGVRCGPNDGNYKFAERWVALDTVIRILSWGELQALSWLPSEQRSDIAGRYGKIQREIAPLIEGGADETQVRTAWTIAYQRELADIAQAYRSLPRYTEEQARQRQYPVCISFFANLAMEAAIEPRALSGRPDTRNPDIRRSLYDDFVSGLSGELTYD